MYLRWAAPPKADGMDTMKAAVYAACVLEGKEVGEDEVAVSVRCSPRPPRALRRARSRARRADAREEPSRCSDAVVCCSSAHLRRSGTHCLCVLLVGSERSSTLSAGPRGSTPSSETRVLVLTCCLGWVQRRRTPFWLS